ncbi:YigZ family protein [Streptomonospora nanhaiensis]|uniref:Putative YigZ family protein n=1 Tax=Streptomonospora nanhaiensis TaxID=1323731 RepID=A0A853BPW0_9ACTN|nr:YigZ family protein [Streptomonospora nanhaiensis]MBV2365928.1 YigZ family protein [Streptomonospora nanhaiensis]MBX9387762.1 YigZ family protein [Streptomonospora nanhaiensis]NYI96637.1 putative YigZ family protein [Streptomonospora nanhaiensis]
MRTIRRGGEHELHIKRSRFLCALARVGSEDEARAFIAERRRLHWGANHNCSAYVLGPGGQVQRSSDDGEPSGTAGVPMLEVLRQRGVTDTAAVVTRYFGGVKLGAGGLVRAYGAAVAAALDEVGVLERRTLLVVEVSADYRRAGRLESDLRDSRYPVRGVHYGDGVRIDVAVPEPGLAGFRAWLAEATGGHASCEVTGSAVVEVEPGGAAGGGGEF